MDRHPKEAGAFGWRSVENSVYISMILFSCLIRVNCLSVHIFHCRPDVRERKEVKMRFGAGAGEMIGHVIGPAHKPDVTSVLIDIDKRINRYNRQKQPNLRGSQIERSYKL